MRAFAGRCAELPGPEPSAIAQMRLLYDRSGLQSDRRNLCLLAILYRESDVPIRLSTRLDPPLHSRFIGYLAFRFMRSRYSSTIRRTSIVTILYTGPPSS